MGCASSKRIEATVDVYRPPTSSFSVFDIYAIEEPWVKREDPEQPQQEKHSHVPPPLLEKLNAIDDAPRSWDEVSKALEDLKPALQTPLALPAPNPKPAAEPVKNNSPPQTNGAAAAAEGKEQRPRKNFSFHTLEELDSKLTAKPAELKKTESMSVESNKTESPKAYKFERAKTMDSRLGPIPAPEYSESQTGTKSVPEGYKPLRENIFILRDKMEREKEGKSQSFIKPDPLSDYPEICPPGGADLLVLYTTSLGGVRRTFEDCNRVRTILEAHRVAFDERDISLHGEFLSELKTLLGEGVSVPRMFVKGRYVGGVDEVVNLNEVGRLGRILNRARVERGVGRAGCEGCGGARFVPCLECGGSCKVVIGEARERCPKCNENGLVHCPACN